MDPAIKAQRALAKLAKFVQQNATDEKATAVATKLIEDKSALKETAREARAVRPEPFYEAEAVLMFLLKPARFMAKSCRRCTLPFMTNYRGVGYCSDTCREKDLQVQGVDWNPTKPREIRWGSEQCPVEPPMMFGPEVLKVLVELASQQTSHPELFRTWSEAPNPERLFSSESSQTSSVVQVSQPRGESLSGADSAAGQVNGISATSPQTQPDLTDPGEFVLEDFFAGFD